MWDSDFESRCVVLLREVLAQEGSVGGEAWRALLTAVGPHVEEWAARSRVLRTFGLTTEDEPRAVLLRVVERMHAANHANLRSFVADLGRRISTRPADEDGLAGFVRLAEALDETMSPETTSAQDDVARTPFRGWLRGLVDFAIADHARARLGRSPRTPDSDAGSPTKRDVNSNAKRFSIGDEGAARPPITDDLTLRQVAGQIMAFARDQLPDQQRVALQLRLDDSSYSQIVAALGLTNEQAAVELVRAAKERLRARFRSERKNFGLDAD